jgi:hypothetical protein
LLSLELAKVREFETCKVDIELAKFTKNLQSSELDKFA